MLLFLLAQYFLEITGIRDKTPNNEILRLKSLGADFKKTNRGGLVTFHGPGQLVAYPIINLKYYKPSVKWYVNSLEEIGIRLCGDLGKQVILFQIQIYIICYTILKNFRSMSNVSSILYHQT